MVCGVSCTGGRIKRYRRTVEVITVSILINGQPIFTRSGVNISEECGAAYGVGEQTYKLDTGENLKHNWEAGVVKLAKKMLGTIKDI